MGDSVTDLIQNITNHNSPQTAFTLWDYGIFGLMLTTSAGIGIFSACTGSRNTTAKEYLVGNRSMGTIPVALSLLASFNSAILMLGNPAETYYYGYQFWFVILGYMFALPISAIFFMPVFYNLGCTSVYEYLERRYGQATRTVCACIFIFQMTFYTAIAVYMPSLALSHVTKIDQWTLVIITSGVCVFYTTIGGIKAVIFTDVFQIIIMFATELVIICLGTYELGGLQTIVNRVYEGGRVHTPDFSMDPTIRITIWNTMVGSIFTWVAIFGCNQTQVQRYVSMKSLKSAKIAILIDLFGIIILESLCMITGFVVYAKYYDCDPKSINKITAYDQILPVFVQESFSAYTGLAGFFIAGIYSAALSTVSSTLNSLSAVTLEDIVKKYINPNLTEERAGFTSKMLAAMYGVLCLGLVALLDGQTGAVELWGSLFGVMGGPICALFIMGFFLPRVNQKCALLGLVSSFAVSIWIVVGAFVSKVPSVRLPVTTEGCDIINGTANHVAEVSANADGVFWLYQTSFMWYSVSSTLIALLVGYTGSFVFKDRDKQFMDQKLFSPFIQRNKWVPNHEDKVIKELDLFLAKKADLN